MTHVIYLTVSAVPPAFFIVVETAGPQGKSADFMYSAMAGCGSVNVDQLIRAALAGEEEIARYLEGTSYAGGADALRESPSAFERWCDNRMIESLKPQKYETFWSSYNKVLQH